MDGLESKDITITVRYQTIGKPEDIAAVTQTIKQVIIPANPETIQAGTQFIKEQVIPAGASMNEAAAAAAASTGADAQSMRAAAQAANDAAKNEYLLAMAERMRTNAANDATAATVGAAAGMRILGTGLRLTGTAIHMIIMGTMEFLAVFLPAMYAAAAGAYTMMQGIQLVGQHVESLYTASEALGPMVNRTAGDMLGLGHAMQNAQDLANPGVYELFGEAIGGIDAYTGRATLGLNGLKVSAAGAKGGLNDFANVGLDVTHMLDAFGAKVVADLQGPLGGTLHSLVSGAVNDLRTFGQILGNLGDALIHLAAAMPGLAEIILHVINGITELIRWFSQLPPMLLTVIFAFEEFYRWGGALVSISGLMGRAIAALGTLGIPLVATAFGNIGKILANLVTGLGGFVSTLGGGVSRALGVFSAEAGDKAGMAVSGLVGKLSTAADFLGGPWGIAVGAAVAAMAVFVIWSDHMKTATQKFIDNINKAVAAASNMQVLNVIAQGMQANTVKFAASQNDLSKATEEYNAHIHDAGRTLATYNASLQAAQRQSADFNQEQQKLATGAVHVVEGAGQISKAYGVDFTTALGLADMAGVKLASSIGKNGQLTAQAAIQIGGLVLGYEKMDQTGGILANSMNAVNIQAGIQSSKVTQLNQAWDQFIQMGTGLTGNFAQFNLDLQQMGNQAQFVGSKINAFTGSTAQSVSQIASDLKSFGATSAQTWQSYNASITQANSFTDSLRVAAAAGVVSQGQYKEAIASVVGQLLPYASQSKAALAELTMISQEAGGPAYNTTKGLTSNYQDLKNWTDQNAVSSGKFAGLLNTLTEKLTNVSKVAQGFAGTLQTDVLNAMASAGASTTRITQLTDNYTNALTKNGSQAPQTKEAQDALTKALESYGFKASDITQMENILSQAYIKNTSSIAAGIGTRLNLQRDIDRAISTVPTAKSDLDKFTNSILNGTSTTRAGESARQNLINDLIKSGVNANTARADVSNMSLAISRIPKTATLNIKESGTGFFTITEGGKNYSISAGGLFSPHASGGPITHGSGPKSDDVLIRASKGEYVMQAAAVDKYGAGMMDAINAGAFASGGLIAAFNKSGGPNAGVASALGRWTDTASNDFVGVVSATMENAILSTAKAAQQAAAAAMIGTAGVASGSGVAALKSAAAKFGWNTGPEWVALNNVEMREAGYNLHAQNPHSSAYGMAQFINGPSEYYQYGGNPNTYAGQAVAMINYIRQRYGDPIRAWQSELSRGFYDQGGWLPTGVSVAVNNTGQPERVSPPGGDEPVIIHNHVHLDGKQIWTNQQQYTLKYNMRNAGKPTGTVIPRGR